MGQLVRSIDWSKTSLGPVSAWPRSLKSTVNMLLNSKFGMFLWWGPDLIQFYNDSYRLSLGSKGEKHPKAMGQKGKDCWQEIWPSIHPQIEQVLKTGVATWNENHLLPIYRNGILENVYWTYSNSPVYDDEGKVAGVLVVESETTRQVVGERRSNFLREFSMSLNGSAEERSFYHSIENLLVKNEEDIPFSFLYVLDHKDQLILSAAAGTDELPQHLKAQIIKGQGSNNDPLKIRLAFDEGLPVNKKIDLHSENNGNGTYSNEIYQLPLVLEKGAKPLGVFVSGISPHQKFDEDYGNFLQSVAREISENILKKQVYDKEVARQQQLEKARSEAENARKRLYDLFMNAPAIIAVFSGPELRFELANPLYKQLVGIKRPLDGKPLFEAIPDIDADLRKIIKKVATKGERFVAKELPVTIDWDYNGYIYTKYLELLYEPLFDNGKPNGFMAFAYDVTEHVRARQLVEEQNKVLKMVTEGKPLEETLSFLATSIEMQSVNHAKASILLLDKEGRHLRHGAAPQLPEEYIKAIDGVEIGPAVGSCGTAAFRGKPVVVKDIANDPLWKDYKELALRHNLKACWSTPIFSSNKKVLGTFALYYDEPRLPDEKDRQVIDFATHTASLMIERKLAEDALLESTADIQQQKRMYDSITGSTPDLVYVIDKNHKFTFVNEALLNMWGKRLDQSLGKTFIELGYEPWHAEMHKKEIQQVIQTKKPIRGEVAFPHAVLGQRIYDYIFAPIFDLNEEVIAIAGTTRDISELKRLEKQKDQFIAVASHELKTPITSIKAYAQILQLRFEKQSDSVSFEMMKKMDMQINRLTNLVNDLLDVSKMQGEKIQFNKQKFQLNELINEISEEIQRTTTRHQIHLYLAKDVTIFGDKERIGQVLTNYLTNAIKYSPDANKINISSEIANDEVIVSVQDFGLGIPSNLKEKVFERFYRVQGRKQETFAGMGLGLFISKEIVARHNGKAWVTSEEGKGSMFKFSLPLLEK